MPLSACCCRCVPVVHVPEPDACRRLHSVHLQARQVGASPGSAVRAWGVFCRADAGWARGTVLCRAGRGPRFRMLALVEMRWSVWDAICDGSVGGVSRCRLRVRRLGASGTIKAKSWREFLCPSNISRSLRL